LYQVILIFCTLAICVYCASLERNGGRLIVGVESDRIAGNSAHLPEKLRLEGLQSISLVDEAFIIDEPVANVILRLRPDIVVKGKEHELLENAELPALDSYGGRLIFSSGEAIFSSLDLIRKEFQELDFRSISIPEDYLERHKITKNRLTELLKGFYKLEVCVVGDLIVDEYITLSAIRYVARRPYSCCNAYRFS
jgi:bifunctional ADP-heptose synthase (sugar kinase/adenylyltransferase)